VGIGVKNTARGLEKSGRRFGGEGGRFSGGFGGDAGFVEEAEVTEPVDKAIGPSA
jgi:hypothetical protein